jgi:hypothetical protein
MMGGTNGWKCASESLSDTRHDRSELDEMRRVTEARKVLTLEAWMS